MRYVHCLTCVGTLLIAVLLVPAGLVHGQYDQQRFFYGVTITAGGKAPLIDRPRMGYKPLGELYGGMFAGIRGRGQHAASAALQVQLGGDDLHHRMDAQTGYIFEARNLIVNPEVSIPLQNRYGESRLSLIGGFGVEILLSQAFTQRHGMGFFGGGNLSPIEDSARAARRNFIPFIAAGFAYRFHSRASLVLRLRQDMRNTFEPGSRLTLFSGSNSGPVNLSAQPTRLLIGCQFLLGKRPEAY